jgi:membrane protein DedA with SNARE-associated domain
VISTGELWTYLGTFIALLAAGMGVPIPEEIPIVTAGAIAGRCQPPPAPAPEMVVGLLAGNPGLPFPAGLPWGALLQRDLAPPQDIYVRWWILLPVCICGVVLSDGLLYGLGRIFGTRLLGLPFLARMMPPEKRERIERNFHRYGIKILLFARLLPGIRAPIFITAGIMRLPLSHFLLADGIYAIPGVSLLFFLAFWFTNSFQELVEHAEERVIHYRHLVIVVVSIVVAVYFLVHFFRKPIVTGDPKELPLFGEKVAHEVAQENDGSPRNEEHPPARAPKTDGFVQERKV